MVDIKQIYLNSLFSLRQPTIFYVDISKANAFERAINKVLQAFLSLSIGFYFSSIIVTQCQEKTFPKSALIV